MICPKCKCYLPLREQEVTYDEIPSTIQIVKTYYCSNCNDYFTALWRSEPVHLKCLWVASDRDGVIEE